MPLTEARPTHDGCDRPEGRRACSGGPLCALRRNLVRRPPFQATRSPPGADRERTGARSPLRRPASL